MDEMRIREIVREEIEAAPPSVCVQLEGEFLGREHLASLVERLNQAIRDGAKLRISAVAESPDEGGRPRSGSPNT